MIFISFLCFHALEFYKLPFVTLHNFSNESNKTLPGEGRRTQKAGPLCGTSRRRPRARRARPLFRQSGPSRSLSSGNPSQRIPPAPRGQLHPPAASLSFGSRRRRRPRPVAHLELVRGRLHQSRHIWLPRGGARRAAEGKGHVRTGPAALLPGVWQWGGGGRLAQTARPAGWRGAQQGSILAAGEPEAQRPPRMRGSGLQGGRGSGLRARRSRPQGGLAPVLGPCDEEQKASQKPSGPQGRNEQEESGRLW